MLDEKFSPEQISNRLRRDHPDRPQLHMTHETIYQAIYVQTRGELRRELTTALRTGPTGVRASLPGVCSGEVELSMAW